MQLRHELRDAHLRTQCSMSVEENKRLMKTLGDAWNGKIDILEQTARSALFRALTSKNLLLQSTFLNSSMEYFSL